MKLIEGTLIKGPWHVFDHGEGTYTVHGKKFSRDKVAMISVDYIDDSLEEDDEYDKAVAQMKVYAQHIATLPDLLAVVKDYIANGHSKALQERAKTIVDKATKG